MIFELADEYSELKPFADKMRTGEKAMHYEFAANSFKSMLLIVRIKTLLATQLKKSHLSEDKFR